jgi:hypothetical protein
MRHSSTVGSKAKPRSELPALQDSSAIDGRTDAPRN